VHLALAGLVALDHLGAVQPLLPGRDGLGFLTQRQVDVAEEVVDLHVLPLILLDRLLQRRQRLLVLLALVQHPAQAVEVGGVVLVQFPLQARRLALLLVQLQRLADQFLGLLHSSGLLSAGEPGA
jgi:hypothetical protein